MVLFRVTAFVILLPFATGHLGGGLGWNQNIGDIAADVWYQMMQGYAQCSIIFETIPAGNKNIDNINHYKAFYCSGTCTLLEGTCRRVKWTILKTSYVENLASNCEAAPQSVIFYGWNISGHISKIDTWTATLTSCIQCGHAKYVSHHARPSHVKCSGGVHHQHPHPLPRDLHLLYSDSQDV